MIGRRAQARALGAGFIGGAHWLADVAAKWRQGRKEAKAIAELNALDDRTLRDIGVSHRSQIISAVRALSERGVLATGVSATPTLAVHGGGSAAAEVRVATSDTTDRAA
ncbi:MAG: DUF1127 domain-containing protein [Gammaproteobacteria bacterium]|nr:DUF1127 domain-containing protein [Gammaproteobacteria bacterium]